MEIIAVYRMVDFIEVLVRWPDGEEARFRADHLKSLP